MRPCTSIGGGGGVGVLLPRWLRKGGGVGDGALGVGEGGLGEGVLRNGVSWPLALAPRGRADVGSVAALRDAAMIPLIA